MGCWLAFWYGLVGGLGIEVGYVMQCKGNGIIGANSFLLLSHRKLYRLDVAGLLSLNFRGIRILPLQAARAVSGCSLLRSRVSTGRSCKSAECHRGHGDGQFSGGCSASVRMVLTPPPSQIWYLAFVDSYWRFSGLCGLSS